MLVSPTEPKELRGLGSTSSVPETYGVDFLFPGHSGLCGVQRKEISDYIASLRDGRLGKELAQMGRLAVAAVVVEGSVEWSRDGNLVNHRGVFTKAQFMGSVFSIQAHGYWVWRTKDKTETAEYLRFVESWLGKARHSGIKQRPKPKNEWGYADNKDWGVHLLQSFPGIGVEVATRIYELFGGVPLRWDCTESDLQRVAGVGKGRAGKLMKALERGEE